MNLTRYAIVFTLISFFITGCSQETPDLSIPMKGGDYKVEITKIKDGRKDPNIKTTTKCFSHKVFDPYKFYIENKDCKIMNIEKTENKVDFDFDCENGVRANAKGHAQYSVDGDNISWKTEIKNISGYDADIVTKSAGKYLGTCR
jgi:hypothetical protein